MRSLISHSSFSFFPSSPASTSLSNTGMFTIPYIPRLHKYLAIVNMCDNFEVKNGRILHQSVLGGLVVLEARDVETGFLQFLVELVLVVVSETLFSKGWLTPVQSGLHSTSLFVWKACLLLDLAIMHAVMQHMNNIIRSVVSRMISNVERSAYSLDLTVSIDVSVVWSSIALDLVL